MLFIVSVIFFLEQLQYNVYLGTIVDTDDLSRDNSGDGQEAYCPSSQQNALPSNVEWDIL